MTEKISESKSVIKPLGELVPGDEVELTIGGMYYIFTIHSIQKAFYPDHRDPNKLVFGFFVLDKEGHQRWIRGDRVKVVVKVNS